MTISLLLIVAGAVFTLALARVARAGNAVAAIMIVSYALRVALAVALYVISAWRLPILSSLQMEDGFWRFSRDAQGNHWFGIAVADSLRWGTELPDFRFVGTADFPLMIGLLYRIVGAHPLYIPLLNAAFCSGILALAYCLARRLNGDRAGIVALVCVAAWPSLYVWSAQILTDPLVLVLTMTLLAMAIMAIEPGLPFAATAGLYAASVPVVMLLVHLRFYIVPFLVAGLCAVVALRLVKWSTRSGPRIAMKGAAFAAVLIACFVVGRGFDLIPLVSPAQPREGHRRKAQYLEFQGETTGAIFEYARANGHVLPPFPPAAVDEILKPRLRNGTQAVLARLSLAEAKGPGPPPRLVPGKPLPKSLPPPLPPPVTVGLMADKLAAQIGLLQTNFLMTNSRGLLPAASGTGMRPANDISDVLLQLPQATATALWAPFPWQWFRTDGDTGAIRRFSAIETMLLTLLTPWLLLGIWRGIRSCREDAWLLIGYAVPAAVLMGLIVTNLGSLFRLRLQFLIPLLITAGAYGASNSRLVAWLVPSLSTRAVEGITPARGASPVHTAVGQRAS